ncbi:hypothetical protein [Alcanivorax quisquiliarum]|uniref:GRAM domain-containing protein n=1 Tax=Alcanivorax quisquiliarum TaxID=2933565 RepID=A0ABT0E4J3_9GAMM|nr:hypothetical protein [Alcanivorax quisquiliarum]MCK0536738.1 hypothetical protein [Alcanivorax quisquiliarum]
MIRMVVCDDRLGKKGQGVLFLPVGLACCGYQVYWGLMTIFSDELLGFESVNVFFIWLLLIFVTVFFIYLLAGGVVLLINSLGAVQSVFEDKRKRFFLRTYWGKEIELHPPEKISIERIKREPFLKMMTLLSKENSNWKVSINGKGAFFLNGDISGSKEFVGRLQSLTEINTRSSMEG